MSCCMDTNQKGSERKMKNQEKKNQKKKEATAKTPKPKEYVRDQASSKECPNCHKVLPLTTEHWWIYKDLRKGPKIEDNVYYPNCRECYRNYRKKLVRKAKKKAKSSKEPVAPKKNKGPVASKKQVSKKKSSKPALESNKVPRKASLDHSPFFLVNLKDEVSQVIPITKNHYIVKKVDTNDRLS